MIVTNTAISAYQNAIRQHDSLTEKIIGNTTNKAADNSGGFGDMLKNSVSKVNQMEQEKELMVEEFAAGKTQNVHELMITLQKAGLAMQMTSTVRGKVMTAYQELMRMPF
ncbi:MAG: flagellar hook-basal body complex protein FliE [Proteobacteria bacterium]|nr:flagellar hook-basal body complex protein FliE [Pseudomonadota bacterium]MBU1612502.1 flagellar hook-basal body complex protein FliE [Pseudomonadota bacterium]